MPDIVISEFMDTGAVEATARDYDVHYDPNPVDQPEKLIELLVDSRGLVVRNRTQVTPELLKAAPNLKVVGRLGVGLDNIDLKACEEQGVTVCPATGANDAAVAQMKKGAVLVNAARGGVVDEKAMAGTMLPMGDAKGAALILVAEIPAAGLTAAYFGFEASSFFSAEGDSPGVGQLLIALAPGPLSGEAFAGRLETLLTAILNQENTLLPGDRRLGLRQETRENGILIKDQLYDQLAALGAVD